jgi:TRAP-type mannitol/chloroaromatic compound transport system permease small subunit
MSDLEGFGFVLPHWAYWGWLALSPLVMVWWSKRKEKKAPPPEHVPDEETAMNLLAEEDPALHAPGNKLTDFIDWFSEQSGTLVAFWTVSAVVAYTYEVVARFIFNSPTIWVSEACFLLFGMQYLLSGAFALHHGSHVRVDVLYIKLSERGRVGMDIFTSVFFFIFALAMAGTSWSFMMDSIRMSETTVETWQIHYGPVKTTMFAGSILLLMAGVSKLIKDIKLFKLLGGKA